MARIRILPSNNVCTARGGDTVLDAGLKSGLALGYGCSNGNCGECLARLVEGEVAETRRGDYRLSEREKRDGLFLMCCHAPKGDITIETREASGAGDIPHQDIQAKIKSVSVIDEQILHLHVRTPRAQRLRFLAGQSVHLGGADGVPDTLLPIASCPCDDMNLHFHVPLVPGDAFSEHAFEGGLKPMQRIWVRGPEGQFVLGDRVPGPLVFIAWHTGFAPISSLIEHAMALETGEDIFLYRLSPQPGRHYLDNLCRSWSDAWDNVHYRPLETRFTLLSDQAAANAVLAEIAERHAPLSAHWLFVAGPPSLTSSAQAFGRMHELEPEQVRTETIGLGFYEALAAG